MKPTEAGAADFEQRRAGSQRAFYKALGEGAPESRVVEVSAGVQATVVPVRPWYAIFNAVLYETATELARAIHALPGLYTEAGVGAWSVWVPPGDDVGRGLVAEAGYREEGAPMAMGRSLKDLADRPAVPVGLVEASFEEIARCNDLAHGVLPEWSMAPVFGSMDDPSTRRYAIRREGRVLSALLARHHEGDCYFWFVATVPDAQGRGLARELMLHALHEAREAGCDTATLESTPVAESLYRSVGFIDLGRCRRCSHYPAS